MHLGDRDVPQLAPRCLDRPFAAADDCQSPEVWKLVELCREGDHDRRLCKAPGSLRKLHVAAQRRKSVRVIAASLCRLLPRSRGFIFLVVEGCCGQFLAASLSLPFLPLSRAPRLAFNREQSRVFAWTHARHFGLRSAAFSLVEVRAHWPAPMRAIRLTC